MNSLDREYAMMDSAYKKLFRFNTWHDFFCFF